LVGRHCQQHQTALTGFQFWRKFPVDRRNAEIPGVTTRPRNYCAQYGKSDYGPKDVPLGCRCLAMEAHYQSWLGRGTVRSLWPGTRLNPRPTAPGPMSALVVGPNGETSPNGNDELRYDALCRVKVRFHWQQAEASDDAPQEAPLGGRDSC